MAEQYPMTIDQRQLLNQDLAEIRGKLEDIVSLLKACCAEQSEINIRAEEASAALQRLDWALEREFTKG